MTPAPNAIADCMLKGCQNKELRAEIERLNAENKQLRDDFWKERERIDLLRAEIARLRMIEDAAINAATYFHMSDGGEEDFDEQRMIDLMAKLGRALEPKP